MKHPILMLAIIATGLTIELWQLSTIPVTKAHTCNYKHCPMKGSVTFAGCGECIEGTDCYLLDSAHWDHPNWNYDQCDSAVFTIQTNQ